MANSIVMVVEGWKVKWWKEWEVERRVEEG